MPAPRRSRSLIAVLAALVLCVARLMVAGASFADGPSPLLPSVPALPVLGAVTAGQSPAPGSPAPAIALPSGEPLPALTTAAVHASQATLPPVGQVAGVALAPAKAVAIAVPSMSDVTTVVAPVVGVIPVTLPSPGIANSLAPVSSAFGAMAGVSAPNALSPPATLADHVVAPLIVSAGAPLPAVEGRAAPIVEAAAGLLPSEPVPGVLQPRTGPHPAPIAAEAGSQPLPASRPRQAALPTVSRPNVASIDVPVAAPPARIAAFVLEPQAPASTAAAEPGAVQPEAAIATPATHEPVGAPATAAPGIRSAVMQPTGVPEAPSHVQLSMKYPAETAEVSRLRPAPAATLSGVTAGTEAPALAPAPARRPIVSLPAPADRVTQATQAVVTPPVATVLPSQPPHAEATNTVAPAGDSAGQAFTPGGGGAPSASLPPLLLWSLALSALAALVFRVRRHPSPAYLPAARPG